MRATLFALSFLISLSFPIFPVFAASIPSCTESSSIITLDPITPLLLRPTVPTRVQLKESTPEITEWYLDGQRIHASQENSFCFSFPIAGNHTLEVKRAFNGQVIVAKLIVSSYSNIQLLELRPSSKGDEEESFTLRNSNPFPVSLSNWELRSLTSRTHVTFNATIPANSSETITTQNRLNNTGGTYGLFNESNELVDVATYLRVSPGDVVVRDGIFWHQPEIVKKEKAGSGGNDTLLNREVLVEGTVAHPNGRTIDVLTDTGEKVRIVLHSSYKGYKPRIYKGDRVKASGIWKRSSRGWYVSVREGYSFLLLYGAQKGDKKSVSSSIKEFVKPITPASAALAFSPTQKPLQFESTAQFPSAPNLWWIMNLLTLLGIGLIIPASRQR